LNEFEALKQRLGRLLTLKKAPNEIESAVGRAMIEAVRKIILGNQPRYRVELVVASD